MGQGCPRENKWDTGARKQCNKKPNDHTESLKEEYAAGPADLGQITSQQKQQSGTAGNGSKSAERSKTIG